MILPNTINKSPNTWEIVSLQDCPRSLSLAISTENMFGNFQQASIGFNICYIRLLQVFYTFFKTQNFSLLPFLNRYYPFEAETHITRKHITTNTADMHARKVREACRKTFHLFSFKSNSMVPSYDQKPYFEKILVVFPIQNSRDRRQLPLISGFSYRKNNKDFHKPCPAAFQWHFPGISLDFAGTFRGKVPEQFQDFQGHVPEFPGTGIRSNANSRLIFRFLLNKWSLKTRVYQLI